MNRRIVLLIVFGHSLLTIADPVTGPTPTPKGVECDRKMREALKKSDEHGIRRCFEDYYSGQSIGSDDAMEVIEQMCKAANQTVCCDNWRFIRCLLDFSIKICTPEENNDWIEFSKEQVHYLEQTKCIDTHYDDPKCPKQK